MDRFSLRTEGEPSGMLPLLEVLSNAEHRVNATQYAVPSEAQTLDYAAAVLSRWCTPSLAETRAANRIDRTQTMATAGVPLEVITTVAALRNLHVVADNRDALLGQLDHLAGLVHADIQAGDRSRMRIGIVPADTIEPLPDRMPPGISYVSPRDVSLIKTPQRTFVTGLDGGEVDDVATEGMRSGVVEERRLLLGQWAADAVYGVPALQLVDESRAALLAA